MARRHGIPSRLSEAELQGMERNPPAWLVQSRSNRTSGRPVWVELTCEVCGFSEAVRPKKWWPQFTWITCDHHGHDELPPPAADFARTEYDGIGTRFIGIVDEIRR